MNVDYEDLEQRLPHLPPRKRRELALTVKILLEEFKPAAQPEANTAQRRGRILKIILFGSYARGSYVEDRKSGYNSDYDLLIITNNKETADPIIWGHVEAVLLREELVTKQIKRPVEFIVHSYYDINAQLKVGRPFFLDILLDGIILYEEKGYRLAHAGNMTAEQQYKEAERYFDELYVQSILSLRKAKYSFRDAAVYGHKALKSAAFEAHQATEHIYHCLLLTLLLYSPKLHNIRKLRSLSNAVAPQLSTVWPEDKRIYKRCFELLRRAYVEARYSAHYKITALQLEWLFGRIEDLQNRVKEICEQHLQAFSA